VHAPQRISLNAASSGGIPFACMTAAAISADASGPDAVRKASCVSLDSFRFRFTGKSGKQWSLKVRDRRVAKIIRACQELPGQELLQYVDEDGKQQDVTSTDVNQYLKEITGQDITAKDFRTWAGTVLAALALKEVESFDTAAQAKRNLRMAIERVAARLGNTPTICRKCYVHPEVLTLYLDGGLVLDIKSEVESESREELAGLQPEEAAVLALLRARLKQTVDDPSSIRLRHSKMEREAAHAACPQSP
jgi:DNA topoisomerase-1